MRRLGNTIARLTAARRATLAANANDDGRLSPVTGFGANPGDLDALLYTPPRTPTDLVVVLHGCTQTAAAYDHGSGWSQLGERHGFAVLFAQQRRSNNPNLCFNWFLPADARRGRGEAASIAHMVQFVAGRHGFDPSRTFITGLSAGGAMTAAMLASYPELFAGGAIIAGLPFATANALPEALERMRGQGSPSRATLAARARAAGDHSAHIPTLSVWHGTHDHIVDRSNASALVDQWRDLQGLGATAGIVEVVDGHRRETWTDTNGRALVERYDVQGMGHGTPLRVAGGEHCGSPGPHMLDAGICSTTRIAEFWGLISAAPATRDATPDAIEHARPTPGQSAAPARPPGPGSVIEDALRAAGLMR
jgi:poly(hydroxyalkanoate) depolymerase family esterase